MDLALNNLQMLICYKTKTNKQLKLFNCVQKALPRLEILPTNYSFTNQIYIYINKELHLIARNY